MDALLLHRANQSHHIVSDCIIVMPVKIGLELAECIEVLEMLNEHILGELAVSDDGIERRHVFVAVVGFEGFVIVGVDDHLLFFQHVGDLSHLEHYCWLSSPRKGLQFSEFYFEVSDDNVEVIFV